MNALNPSHAALVAEVTALRATLNDAVELVESLRSERDTKQRACDALKLHIDQQTNDAVKLRSERDALRAALDIMVRTFNVEVIEPFAAFASIEQARAALERAAL